jgi:hypothetical protein
MEIKIAKTICNKEEAASIMNQVFSILEETFRPGWYAILTISLDRCQGKLHTDPPEDAHKQ